MSSLDKIRVKIERAKEHIQNFDSAKRIFLESNPYVVASRYLPDFGEQGQTVYHLAKAVAIPERLSLIAGDAIHNLRCALDYLAYQLAEASSPGGFDENKSFFPISDGLDNYEARLRGDLKSILRQEVIDTLRTLQPYKGGKGHGNTLWCLHRLDILDKHRLLIPKLCTTQPSSEVRPGIQTLLPSVRILIAVRFVSSL